MDIYEWERQRAQRFYRARAIRRAVWWFLRALGAVVAALAFVYLASVLWHAGASR